LTAKNMAVFVKLSSLWVSDQMSLSCTGLLGRKRKLTRGNTHPRFPCTLF